MKNLFTKQSRQIIFGLLGVLVLAGAYFVVSAQGTTLSEKLGATLVELTVVTRACNATTAPWIQVVSPNGGEVYTVGQQVIIKWKSCNYPNPNIDIILNDATLTSQGFPPSTTGTFFAQSIPVNQGYYQFTIPVSFQTNPVHRLGNGNVYKIKLGYGAIAPYSVWDESDNLFAINKTSISVGTPIPATPLPGPLPGGTGRVCNSTTAPWVQVISPNGGEIYTAGQQMKISWTSCNVPSSEKVDISLIQFNQNGTRNGTVVATVTPNDGQESYTIPAIWPPGSNFNYGNLFRVYVRARVVSDPTDSSDNLFTINAPISKLTLTYPNTGTFSQGQTVNVTYKGGNTSWPILLQLINSAGTQVYQTIVSGAPYNNGTYAWTIPTTVAPGQYTMYIHGNRGSTPSDYDYGDGLITVNPGICSNDMTQTMVTNSQFKNWGQISLRNNPTDVNIGEVTITANCQDVVLNGPEIDVRMSASGAGAFSSFKILDGNTQVASASVTGSGGIASWARLPFLSGIKVLKGQSKTLTYWGRLNPASLGKGTVSINNSSFYSVVGGTPNSSTQVPGDSVTAQDASFTIVP